MQTGDVEALARAAESLRIEIRSSANAAKRSSAGTEPAPGKPLEFLSLASPHSAAPTRFCRGSQFPAFPVRGSQSGNYGKPKTLLNEYSP